ncbi:Pentatricopeptide repeat-containing protein At1g63080, partial [Durusdinium trenchii]
AFRMLCRSMNGGTGASYIELLRRLNEAAEEGRVDAARELYLRAVQRRGAKNRVICNTFLKALANAGETLSAEQFFEEMEAEKVEPNAKTFGKLIEGAARVGDTARALHWFHRLSKKFHVDVDHYNMLARAFFVSGDLVTGARWLFEETGKRGIEPDIVGYNQYLDALSVQGRLEEAQQLFQRLQCSGIRPNVRSFNSLIKVCAKSVSDSGPAGALAAAEGAFRSMLEAEVQPDTISYNSLCDACARAGDSERAREWLCAMTQASLQPDVVSSSTLIRAAPAPQRGHLLQQLREQRQAVDSWAYAAAARPGKSSTTSTTGHGDEVIDACAQQGDLRQAGQWLRACEEEHSPNLVTYNSVLNTCASRGAASAAEGWLEEMLERRLRPNLISFNSVLKAYARSKSSGKSTDAAERLFRGMTAAEVAPDLISYNSALSVAVATGSPAAIERWVRRLCAAQLRPDGATFTTLLREKLKQKGDEAESGIGAGRSLVRRSASKAMFGPRRALDRISRSHYEWLLSAGGQPNGHAYAKIIAMCDEQQQGPRQHHTLRIALAHGEPAASRAMEETTTAAVAFARKGRGLDCVERAERSTSATDVERRQLWLQCLCVVPRLDLSIRCDHNRIPNESYLDDPRMTHGIQSYVDSGKEAGDSVSSLFGQDAKYCQDLFQYLLALPLEDENLIFAEACYESGMHFIAGVLVAVMEAEEAFWCLCSIIDLFRRTFDATCPALAAHLAQLPPGSNRRSRGAKVGAHVGQVAVEHFIVGWFKSFFMCLEAPFEMKLRHSERMAFGLLDSIFVQGRPRFVFTSWFRFMQCKTFEEAMQLFHVLPIDYGDCSPASSSFCARFCDRSWDVADLGGFDREKPLQTRRYEVPWSFQSHPRPGERDYGSELRA